MQQDLQRPVALITGGSRGIGAATALALADRGFDIALTYRNKVSRAEEVAEAVTLTGVRVLALACDITLRADIDRLFTALRHWSGRLDVVVLNASGGLERDRVATDPTYPMRLNRDGQLAVVDGAVPLMAGGVIVFVTSHWAHRYGQVTQPATYAPVAESKQAGEQALRARQAALAERGIRLVVVTGDVVEGTITPKLLERTAPGLAAQRRAQIGTLPTTTDMAEAIVLAATNETLRSGQTIVVGGALDSLA